MYEQRLWRLEAQNEIRLLKARYAAWADAKYTQDHQRQPAEKLREVAWQQSVCFTEDACWYAGDEFGGTLQGRELLFDWFNRAPWNWAMHHYTSPIIELVDDHNAKADWRLFQVAIQEKTDQVVLLSAVTEETYRYTEEGWLHSSVKFKELQLLNLKEDVATIVSALA
ncbi:nuclear transport factor 2 family protein [Paenalcaligenes hominis]|uniref:nuclear transport factor 2 family protein n=1 Tax=Paenalcaligenes hominis TaxID=643674 RepID=UPI003524F0E0